MQLINGLVEQINEQIKLIRNKGSKFVVTF